MPLICLFFYLVFSEVEGFQSRFTSLPSKPTVSHDGRNVTFVWRYRLSHADKTHLKQIVFGLWSDGDVSTPLMTWSKNGSLSFHSDRLAWKGSNRSAVFRLNNVTLEDGKVYGCKLDFGAFTVRDSVRLVVTAPPRIKKDGSPLSQVSVSEGQSVVIPCDVSGNPAPWVSWTRNGQILRNSTGTSGLQVKSALQNMTGMYTCVAWNELGSDKHDVLLLVTSCQHQSSGVKYHPEDKTNGNSEVTELHTRSTFTPTLVVAFVIFFIFTVYFFFRCAGKKGKKLRKYNRMTQDEQARSLMGEWSTFTDNGEKI